MAELVCYVKWARRTRGGQERPGTRPFCDLVGRAGRPREQGPEMEEGRWRRLLVEALPGVDLECPKERGRKPRVRMLRSCCTGRGGIEGDMGGTMARRRAGLERVHMGDRM